MTIRPLCLRLLATLLILAAVPAFAANREVTITAPAEVKPGTGFQAVVTASTDAGGGEQIGFLHIEYSVDGGKTWTSHCYEEKVGNSATRTVDLLAGIRGAKIIVRTRVAFRGGKAGDVDYLGGPIQWNETWEKWLSPSARVRIIYVK